MIEHPLMAKADADRQAGEERRRIAEATSRRERLEKLRAFIGNHWFVEKPGNLPDDELLAFAARVHEIMEVY